MAKYPERHVYHTPKVDMSKVADTGVPMNDWSDMKDRMKSLGKQ